VTELLAPYTVAHAEAIELRDLARRRRSEAVLVEWARRSLDIALALIAIVLTLPIVLVALAAIRIESRGSVLFRQERLGRYGTRFHLFKLRSMYVDCDERWPDLIAYDLDDEDLSEYRFHLEHDPRVTRVGRFMRRTSIDELPNLWNVLLGDMSMVGPRPEIDDLMPYYGDAREVFLSVKPGVTSLAKVSGRDGLTFTKTLELDLEYVRRRSVLLDLKILAATIGAVALQRGVCSG
jgi:exopolysaccharide production protein ExoY